MDLGPLRRRTIALVAAYAMALQALLLAFVPVSLAASAGPFAVLCSHDAPEGTGTPAGHDLPCAALCAAMGHGVAGPLPADFVAVVGQPNVFAADVPIGEWRLPPIARMESHAPRGPPLG